MNQAPFRRPAVAGTWYPGTGEALAAMVDRFLEAARVSVAGEIRAIVVPHAGLVYSGPVAAFAYAAVAGRDYDVAVIVGPSHQVGFDGVAASLAGTWGTPYGPVPIAADVAARVAAECPVVRDLPGAHAREHSLEIQLPFLARVLPGVPIVPLLMGYQRRETIDELAAALPRAVEGRSALLVASTDLSHYHDAREAGALDARVRAFVDRFDPEGLQAALDVFPDHACGGGPTVAVMKAARALGALDARVLRYADSGDVSGDKSAVVGYLAAAIGVGVGEPVAAGG